MKVAMTGVSGHMGAEALAQALSLACAERVRILLTPKKRNEALAERLKKQYGDRVQTVFGNLDDRAACAALVEGTADVSDLGGLARLFVDGGTLGSAVAQARRALGTRFTTELNEPRRDPAIPTSMVMEP